MHSNLGFRHLQPKVGFRVWGLGVLSMCTTCRFKALGNFRSWMNRLVASSPRVAWFSEHHVEQTLNPNPKPLNPKPWLSFGFLGFWASCRPTASIVVPLSVCYQPYNHVSQWYPKNDPMEPEVEQGLRSSTRTP